MSFYYPRRLGIRRLETSGGNTGQSDTAAPAHYNVWREGGDITSRDYEEFAEDRVLKELETSPSNRFGLILGEPGSGKTNLLENWFVQLAQRAAKQCHLGITLPILVPLRRIPKSIWEINSEDKLADELWDFASTEKIMLRESLDAVTISDLYRGHGRFFNPLWLFDGLDEVPDENVNERLYKRLVNLPGRKVVSARTAVFQGIRHVAGKFKGREYEIMGLKPEEQREFLLQTFAAIEEDRSKTGQRVDKIIAEMQRNASVRVLASNTLLLALMAEVTTGEERDILLPSSRALFYESAVNRLWHRKLWNNPALLRLRNERDKFLTQKAEELGLVKVYADFDSSEALEEALRTAGIVQVYKEDGRFEFVHRTFQEYYLAKSLSLKGFRTVLELHWSHEDYEETLSLLVSLLFHEAKYQEIEEGIVWLIGLSKKIYIRSSQLRKLRRSPLRTALHILSRSAINITSDQLPHLTNNLRQFVLNAKEARRAAVARDRSTPIWVLRHLGSDENKSIRQMVAKNTETPLDLLAQLADDVDHFVRSGIAHNSSTPPNLLTFLANDQSAVVLTGVAINGNTPAAVLLGMADDPRMYVRWQLALNPSAPTELLTRLANDQEKAVRGGVAKNPNTNQETLLRLADDDAWHVREELALNPNIPSDLLMRLENDVHSLVRASVVTTMKTRDSLVRRADDDWFVLKEIALNPNTPTDVLARLANHDHSWVRGNVARNIATPASILASLMSDKEGQVRASLATNPNLSQMLIARLADDKDKDVREKVAENSMTHPEVLARLIDDKDLGVRIRAMRNENILLEDL
jgi:hypothetical protein